ncbi:MAG: hypothetical protein EA417_00965 [Gammaproteobacteria bacterium]|nr:MAG: hypothetical protein EA417_00965 [Gammaproteobacteria bacterium]
MSGATFPSELPNRHEHHFGGARRRTLSRDLRKADALEAWLGDVVTGFGDRVLRVDTAVAEEWGQMNGR